MGFRMAFIPTSFFPDFILVLCNPLHLVSSPEIRNGVPCYRDL